MSGIPLDYQERKHWFTQCPYLSRIIDQFFVLNPDVKRPESILEFWSFEQIGDGKYLWHSEPDEIILIGGGYARAPLDFGKAIVIVISGSIEAPLTCGYFYQHTGIVWKEGMIIEQLRVIE